MRSSLFHPIMPGIILAFAFCLMAPDLSLFGQRAPLCLAGEPGHGIPALAQVSVQANVVASDKRLSLLDFCEADRLPEAWRALLAGVDLGPAPDVGHEMSFKSQQLAHQLERLITAQGLDPKQTEMRLPEKITVTRSQSPLTREQIEELFKEFVLKNAPWKTDDLVIRQISFSSLPALPAGHLSIEVTAAPHERFVGEVSVTMHFHIDGKEVRNMRVSGKVDLFQEVIHSVRAMKRNDVITEADIQSVRANIAARPERYVSQREQVVGKKLLCSVGPNQPLSPRELDEPSLIKRGDAVTIVYEQEGIRLSTKGEARGNGAQGGRIRIRNLDSKKDISCQIIDSQTVAVVP
jgi:flagellar basal body P-ring formation protein FlgA